MKLSKSFSAFLVAASIGTAVSAFAKTTIVYSFDPQGVNHPASNLSMTNDGKIGYGMTNWSLFSVNFEDGTAKILAPAMRDSKNNGQLTFGDNLTMSPDGDFLYGTENGWISGVVFRYDLKKGQLTTLHRFDLDENFEGGYDTTGPIVLTKDGKTAFGMTNSGGKVHSRGDGGVIYKLSTDKSGNDSFQVIHSFTKTRGGSDPSVLVLSPDNTFLYGVTTRSAAPDFCGSLFRINLANHNKFKVLKKLNCSTDFPRLKSLVVALDGKTLYAAGEGPRDGSILKIDLKTSPVSFTTLHTFDRFNQEGVNPSNLTLSADGKSLYGINHGIQTRGRSVSPIVFKITLDGNEYPYEIITDFSQSFVGSLLSLSLLPQKNKLYTMSQSSGQYHSGAVFQIDTSNQ